MKKTKRRGVVIGVKEVVADYFKLGDTVEWIPSLETWRKCGFGQIKYHAYEGNIEVFEMPRTDEEWATFKMLYPGLGGKI